MLGGGHLLGGADVLAAARSCPCPPDLRKAVYTTNSIENLNRQIRKTIKTRGSFPDEQAATELIYLAIHKAQRSWEKAYNWPAAVRALKIHFPDRIPD
jgi:putative transposase